MTNRSKVIIAGCGLAGPVTAIALTRAGYDVTIYEARPSSNDAGAFLNLASNGLAALSTIEVDRAATCEGFATPRMTMWSGSGKKLGDVANGMTLADGTSSITVRRAGLHRALRREAERRGIAIVEGRRVVEAETIAGDVAVVRFDDGSETTADLLVGADGLWSRIRRAIDPGAPQPRYCGMLSIGGFAQVPELDPTPETFHMVFGRRAFFGYSVTASREVYWFANVAHAAEPSREELASTPAAAWRSRLLELFEGDRGPMRPILEAADGITVHPVHDMPSVPCWHRGRLVLVGDAAHATSPSAGQGASMAFEDAVVLAAFLRDRSERDIERALDAYACHRRSRVERVLRYSARLGNTKVLGPLGSWLRDALMPVGLKYFASPKAHAWLYAHPIERDIAHATS
ncbi:MAG: monooxygenase [Myxococcales bacterium 68-20]|nr:FAD-dependent monooxygenase [Myxococcales bacterium]OJY18618.1 MAG: monooxygenase [Myxococcales bacterium 68-20]